MSPLRRRLAQLPARPAAARPVVRRLEHAVARPVEPLVERRLEHPAAHPVGRLVERRPEHAVVRLVGRPVLGAAPVADAAG